MENQTPMPPRRTRWLQIVLIVVCVAALTSVFTVWLAKVYLFPKEFKPVRLNAREEKVLDSKIDKLTGRAAGVRNGPPQASPIPGNPLEPERYSETGANREIQLTERELNALLARNTDLARKIVIDLSENLASAKLLLPLDPEFPFLGGKTLKVTAGLELRYAAEKPVVILRGISVWGVPIPNAWLGGIKNIDLVREFGMQKGFWRTFAAGVEDIRIAEGGLTIKLKE